MKQQFARDDKTLLKQQFVINHTTLVKQQFVTKYKMSQTEIPTIPDSWVTSTLSVKMLCPHTQTKAIPYIFFRLLMICEIFSSPVKLCIRGPRRIPVS